MNDLIELGKLFRNNPAVTIATLIGIVSGAFMGVTAFYNGWLG